MPLMSLRPFRRLLHKLGIWHSPSLATEDAGRELAACLTRGMEQGARETAGMSWEQRARHVAESTSPEMLAHAEGAARRSFAALREDEEGDGLA